MFGLKSERTHKMDLRFSERRLSVYPDRLRFQMRV